MSGKPRFLDLTVANMLASLAQFLAEHEVDGTIADRAAKETFDHRCAILAGLTGETPEQVRARVRAATEAAAEQRQRALAAEADVRAHDRVEPDGVYDCFAALAIYVEAFLAGARYADERRARR